MQGLPERLERQMKARLACLSAVFAIAAWAAPEPATPTVDASALPALGKNWLETNPYRGNAEIAELGHQIYSQTCQRCHGPDADGSRSPAADLRRLDAYCLRIEDADLRAWCTRDVDAYFLKSIRHGKKFVGTVHMPPWEGVLSQEQMWAIKTYIETRKP